MDATLSGALYRSRRRRLSRVILQNLTPWSTGLVISSVGLYVSSENGTSAWQSQNTGTTGAIAPTGTGLQSDGTITWLRVDIQTLLQFLNSSPPTP